MKTEHTLSLLAVVVAMAMCTVTEAFRSDREQDDRGGRGDFISRLDTNGDGAVSEDEFDGPLEHFDHMDQNADGYIDETEAPQGPPPGCEQNQGGTDRVGHPSFIDRLDQDGDGLVSIEEFDGPPEHFDHFDANGDGYIEEAEAPQGPPPPRGGSGEGNGFRANRQR